jgi:tetratricopeptide (TPR) repeat protein
VKLGRWTCLPLIPAAIAFLLAVFLPQAATQQASATQEAAAVQKQIKKSSETLRRKLVDRRKEAREKGLKDAEDMFDKLERQMKEQTQGDQADRKQSLVKLNNLAQDLEKRRQDLANGDKLRQQLNQLKPSSQGPADKLGQALKEGDMKQAMKEIEKLKQQLNEGKLDEKARQDLAKQMEEMQQKLKQMAESHEQAKRDLEQQIREKRDAGQSAEAEKLQQQLDKMKQQDQQMQQAKEMAQKMGQCAQCMKQGQTKEAAEAMEQMQAELEQMQARLEEMQMLDEALDEIAECKDGMCEQPGQGNRGKADRPGDGLGEGRGRGDRPEQATDKKFYDSKVKQKVNGGSAVVTGSVDGPNIKGDIEQEIKTQIESAKTESADPLTGQRLPREYRDHARKYFDLLREGAPAE